MENKNRIPAIAALADSYKALDAELDVEFAALQADAYAEVASSRHRQAELRSEIDALTKSLRESKLPSPEARRKSVRALIESALDKTNRNLAICREQSLALKAELTRLGTARQSLGKKVSAFSQLKTTDAVDIRR